MICPLPSSAVARRIKAGGRGRGVTQHDVTQHDVEWRFTPPHRIPPPALPPDEAPSPRAVRPRRSPDRRSPRADRTSGERRPPNAERVAKTPRAPRPARAGIAWAAVAGALLGGVGIGMFTSQGLATKVHLMVDGEPITVRTFAGDIKDTLDSAGIGFDDDDHVSPAPATPVHDSMEIVVRHARRLTLVKDGKRYVREVTALNVGDALKELDIDGSRAKLSASLLRQVPVSGFKLTMETERRVVIVKDGRRVRAVTTARTVRDVLAQQGITLAHGERTHPAPRAFPKDGQIIRVTPAAPPHTVPVQASVAALDWAALADCETSGDPRAASPPNYGMYHISLPMWQAVGGVGNPTDWPAAEQTYRAQLLYQRVEGRWPNQWPTCGAHLFGR